MNNLSLQNFGHPPGPHGGGRGHGPRLEPPPGGWPTPVFYAGGLQPYIAPYPIDCEMVRACLQPTPIYEKPAAVLGPLEGVEGVTSADLLPVIAGAAAGFLLGLTGGKIGTHAAVSGAVGAAVALVVAKSLHEF